MSDNSNIPNNGDTNADNPLHNIPLQCLGTRARQLLSAYLNPPKILLSENGHHRDWRGVFHFTGLPRPYANFLLNASDHFGEMLKLWIDNKENPGTLAQLQKILGIIDRWDVLDDTSELFEQDTIEYLIQKAKIDKIKMNAVQIEKPKFEYKPESNLLTVDDMQRAQQGLPLQQYDAFVLFADEDIDFATKMIDKIEETDLKVCVKERDLLGGINFEHDAIRNLLTNRCNRLIVILSPAFIASPANEFIANLAQSLGITQRRRKIIPCLYQPCELPEVFQHMHLLNYQRSKKFNNFWQKLNTSLVDTPDENTLNLSSNLPLNVPSITLTDVDLIDTTDQVILSSNNSITSTPQNRNVQENINKIEIVKSDNVMLERPSQISISSPSSPNLLRKLLHIETKRWASSTQSLNTLDDRPSINSNNNLSKLSLNGLTKKRKWYKKLLTSPSNSQKLAGSDSELNSNGNSKEKKKKWFRKKISSHS